MSPLILHHYPLSPFSEKIRAMLGYAGLPWQSVITREMPPRPHLEVLAGGYRKIPVAQIGADIFCDTRTIATEIARLSGKPELALEHCAPEIRDYIAHTDLQAFLACVLSAGGRELGRKVSASLSPREVLRLLADRVAFGRGATVSPMDIFRARPSVHVADVERRLGDRAFLFGDTPCHADFSTWHSLWFLCDQGGSRAVLNAPRTRAWMARMRAFGQGRPEMLSPEQALAAARDTAPRPVPEAFRTGPHLGKAVRIAPSDYGRIATEGVLAGESPSGWILAREAPGVGPVHVHFPKDGFRLDVP